MNVRKYILFLLILVYYTPVLAQVDTGWVRRYNGPGNSSDGATALALDDSGNVYMTGSSGGDYATIKYAPNGDTLWVRRYNGPGNGDDGANALAVDGSGNVYVTGSSGGSGTAYDYATIKYSPTGDTVWVRRYNGPGNDDDGANALAVDGSGNVYVTGSSWSDTPFDYATIKYSSAGDTLWVRRYNGPGNDNDGANALAVDGSGNVYVTGYSWSGTTFDYATIKYSSAGDTLWVRRYNVPWNSQDYANALAIDDSGNVYVTGHSGGSGTAYDYATIKYAPNGDTVWVRRYDGPAYYEDYGGGLAVDGNGNVYVTGRSVGNGTYYDYATIKYSPNGDTLWVKRYNGLGNGYDAASALVVDDSGNAYVTGWSVGNGTYDYATIKYAPNGDTLWVRRYNGPENGNDEANALAVDDSGNVYVTGYSGGDYVTIKYNKFGCAAMAGDVNGDYYVDLSDIMLQINYLFKAGPKPDPFCSGDANANGNILLTDIVYLINYIFKSGPAPIKSNECCL